MTRVKAEVASQRVNIWSYDSQHFQLRGSSPADQKW